MTEKPRYAPGIRLPSEFFETLAMALPWREMGPEVI